MKKKLWTSLALVATFTMGMIVNAGAEGTIKDIAAQLNYNITVKLNNQIFTPKDASTNAPIVYNGTTYLPLSTVGEVSGLAVTWDAATSTVYLGSKTETPLTAKMYKSDSMQKYSLVYTTDADMLAVPGTTFSNGIVATSLLMQGNKGTFKTEGKFQTISFTAVSTARDIKYQLMNPATKEVLKDITVTSTPTTYEVNIKGLDEVVLNYNTSELGDPTKVVFGNIKFK